MSSAHKPCRAYGELSRIHLSPQWNAFGRVRGKMAATVSRPAGGGGIPSQWDAVRDMGAVMRVPVIGVGIP
ncbi:hypothetical protein GCM10009533_06100 [Saccharopolyspora spinosporotrichia]|uniref:Uncharacterized protein n=1 Tax=Saccharopolyspora erythraea TaxID=1836 RepID=A0ABN1C1Y7_SACER